MDLDIGDKVRFKKGAYSTLKMGGTQVEWRLGLGGLIGEVEYKHWRGGNLPDLYRVRVHHPKSGITVTDDFDLDEIEGPLVEAGFGKQPATDNAVTGSLSRDPGNSRRCPYSPAECGRPYCPHGLYCAHGKDKP